MKKHLITKQFKVKGAAKIDVAVNKFMKANSIELTDVSQLSFSSDHTSAILVFVTDEDKKIVSADKEEEEKE